MADEHFVVMTVECQHCKTKQKVHIAASTDGAQVGNQTIQCINCNNHFKVTIPDKIVDGPFPVQPRQLSTTPARLFFSMSLLISVSSSARPSPIPKSPHSPEYRVP